MFNHDYLFTAESVAPGHPDKLCDQISDQILDLFLSHDPNAKVACECMALQSKLESVGLITRVQSAISMVTVCEPYIRRKAIRHMEKGRVVIFAAGLGKPYVTTDTGAALNAIEMRCDVLMKATQVDGIYTSDPKKDKAAVKFDRIDYKTALTDDKINIMDSAAISLASENGMPIIVFDIHKKGELKRVLQGKGAFTIVE